MDMVPGERWLGMDGHDGSTAGKDEMAWEAVHLHSAQHEEGTLLLYGRTAEGGSSHGALASWAGGVRQSNCAVVNDGVLVSIRRQGVPLSCVSIVLLWPFLSNSA